MTARDVGKTAPRGREAPLLDLALVSNSGISLPYPRYIRKATALACPSQVRATSPVKRPRLWGSEVRAPVALICQYIDSRKEEFGVEPICKVLTGAGVKIAPSTYYARRSRSPSARSLRDEILKAEISKVYKDNYSVLGTRKMHVMLNRPEAAERHGAGHVARCTVERLMGDLGLRGVRRARSPRTTRSAPREQCPADLVKRHFSAFRPNELWVADITYVRTFSGWVYVAFVTDVFSRRIVGWQTSTSLYTDLALDALQMAVWQRKRAGADLTGLVHHSDRGVQYRSIRYGQALADCEAVASVGSKGDLLSASLWLRCSSSLYKAGAHP